MSGPSDLARTPSLLATRLYGRSLEVLAETGSTNDDARAAAERCVARGHVVVADAQRSGRGARGAVWSSPPGTDLYLSIVERLELAPREVATLTLAVGLGVRFTSSPMPITIGPSLSPIELDSTRMPAHFRS